MPLRKCFNCQGTKQHGPSPQPNRGSGQQSSVAFPVRSPLASVSAPWPDPLLNISDLNMDHRHVPSTSTLSSLFAKEKEQATMQLTPVRSLGEGRLPAHLCRASEGPKRQEDVLCAHRHLVQNWPKERSWQVPLHDGVVGAPMVAACAKRGYCHDWLERELPITCMLRLRATGPLCRSTRFL